VVLILSHLAEVDLHPLDLTAEIDIGAVEVISHARRGVGAQIGGLVRGEHRRAAGIYSGVLATWSPLRYRVAVPTLARAATVVIELDPQLLLARGKWLLADSFEVLEAEQVVAELVDQLKKPHHRIEYTIRTNGVLFAGAGRNDPCPCGSGAKFKRCHGAADTSVTDVC
jgi:hypothetical protein